MPMRAATSPDFAAIDRVFETYCLDAHVPGLVYGVIAGGRLWHVAGLGVQDLEQRRPVDADTVFRIASMTKAFTALTVLKLRDEGRLRLDDPLEAYVPEAAAWAYPSRDSARIRVRDLLNHCAGLVTDDPWGDRQNPLPDDAFGELLGTGIAMTRPPGLAYEYSNLGYALLGRIITRCSGQPYADTIARTLLQPLGMVATGFDAEAAPDDRRALGYRWEDHGWRREPVLAHGSFGAMGGLCTSARDYARWIAFLLAAWPARDDPDPGPVCRATVRELAQGSNFPRLRLRPGALAEDAGAMAASYGMGLDVALDGTLGLTLSHSGGYPGYGSHMLLLPERGLGIFALANRTYAGPAGAVWDAVEALASAGMLPAPKAAPPSPALVAAHDAVRAIYAAGDVSVALDALAMNFLLDRDAEGWSRDLADWRRAVGACQGAIELTPTGRLSGDFVWRCAHGRLRGCLTLTPTVPPTIQSLSLEVIPASR